MIEKKPGKYMTPETTNAAIEHLAAEVNASKAVLLFQREMRNWLAHHSVDIEPFSSWANEGMEALMSMAEPVGGIENLAKMMDLAVNRSWPEANREDSGAKPLAVDILSRSKLVTSEARHWSRRIHGNAAYSDVSFQATPSFTPQQQELFEQEIIRNASGGGHLKRLSSGAILYLQWLLKIIAALYVAIAAQGTVRTELCFYQPKLIPFATANQAGKALRTFFCDPGKPEVNWADYRQVKGVGVKLRLAPSMRAGEVDIKLPDRAILEILDATNSTWLRVSVLGDEAVDGWISRAYTNKLHR